MANFIDDELVMDGPELGIRVYLLVDDLRLKQVLQECFLTQNIEFEQNFLVDVLIHQNFLFDPFV